MRVVTTVAIIAIALFCCALLAGTPETGTSAPPAAPSKATAKAANAPAGKININNAGVHELDALPGIGAVVAQRIVSYRQEHGRFQKAEDLMAVKGIGEKLFAKIRPHISTE